MKCIFCLQEKPSSDEHVIPDSIGGTLHIKEVCRECNSTLSRLVDNPFANCSLIQLARYTHSLGGKRDNIPFPFNGIGTIDTGQKVSLNRNFVPHFKRNLDISETSDGGLKISFNADAADKENFDKMLGAPFRKVLIAKYPDFSDEKIDKLIGDIVNQAKAQAPISDRKSIKQKMSICLDDLLFEFLKIAYELWFKRFGYPWVEESATANVLRTAIMNKNSISPIRGKLFCPDIPHPMSDPNKNHMIIQMDGICVIRLFNICCLVGCELTNERFQLSEEHYHIIFQDFISGTLTEGKYFRSFE